MYRYIVIDDEELTRKGTIAKLKNMNHLVTCAGEAGDGQEALLLIERENPDIIITDMNMPNMSGSALLPLLAERYSDKPIIVISGYKDFEYTRQAIRAKAVDYLLKPFDPEKLCRILSTIQFRQSQNSRYIELISDRTPVKVPIRSILYADTYRNAVQVHTTDAGIIRSYITFQKFEELLEGMKCFLSCYRGCIVNMDHIEKSTDEGFVMDNQELVTVRKRGSNAIKKAYLEYLFSSDSDK